MKTKAAPTKKLTVPLGQRSYPITISDKISTSIVPQKKSVEKTIVITNETLAFLYQKKLSRFFSARWIVIPDGESHKTLSTLEHIVTQLIDFRADRQTQILAFGGGVIGDIAGLAAATFMRGIPYVQVPTSLLAMVDSAVGGKVAVNHPLGKNMIGAFYQPRSVHIATDFLKTLPDREMRCGLAEIIKYGIALDAKFFDWLENNQDLVLTRQPEAVSFCIHRACSIKAAVVASDEKDTGRRMILNFGHTFAHAIERVSGYEPIKHGESVFLGMVAALCISLRLKKLSGANFDRMMAVLLPQVDDIFSRSEVKKSWLALDKKDVLNALYHDKKVSQNQIQWIMSTAIGKTEIVSGIHKKHTEEAFDFLNYIIHETLA
ncbi:MAG TPA: 3-dehydroquinate synthase [bacterium]|nr:3-dehydroquinate synthase [bacterium]HNB56585.1 3-dehydroquinate synthase [bacterium]HNH30934.1 3-dehydroquinate synthase [bacterium]HNI09541.1 3-dehydroquinate synthase [bacterium]HNM13315.1 3-dehydroquinate synthase [bacterium]